MKTLSKEDLENYIIGSGILGCGGGGGAVGGMTYVDEAFKKGLKLQLADITELPKNRRLCTISGVGGGVSQEDRDRVAPYANRAPRNTDSNIQRLKRVDEEMSKYIGEEILAYLPSETGPGNGVMPMYLNAMLGKPIIDGDGCGRAKPEIGISLTHVAGIPITPIVMVTPFDETVIAKTALDDYRGEDITRFVAVASGGGVTAARCPATVQEYENGIAKGQVTRCIKIGATIKQAREKGQDPTSAFQKETNAYKMFEGKALSLELEGRRGFNWGNWNIDGAGDFKGQKLRIWVKNENLVSWINDAPYVTSPDLICVVDAKTCEGLSNFGRGEAHKGKNVVVFGIRAIDQWRKPRGIEIFGPKHFGFDFDYRKIEDVMEK